MSSNKFSLDHKKRLSAAAHTIRDKRESLDSVDYGKDVRIHGTQDTCSRDSLRKELGTIRKKRFDSWSDNDHGRMAAAVLALKDDKIQLILGKIDFEEANELIGNPETRTAVSFRKSFNAIRKSQTPEHTNHTVQFNGQHNNKEEEVVQISRHEFNNRPAIRRAREPNREMLHDLEFPRSRPQPTLATERPKVLQQKARHDVWTVIDLGDENDRIDKLVSSMRPTVEVKEQTHCEPKVVFDRAPSSYRDKTSARSPAPRPSPSSATAPISPPQNAATGRSDNAEAGNAPGFPDSTNHGVAAVGNIRAEDVQLAMVAHDGNVDNKNADVAASQNRVSAMLQKGRERVRHKLLLDQAGSGGVLATSIAERPTPVHHQKPRTRLAAPSPSSGQLATATSPSDKEPRTADSTGSQQLKRKAAALELTSGVEDEDETSLFIPQEVSAPAPDLGKCLFARRC